MKHPLCREDSCFSNGWRMLNGKWYCKYHFVFYAYPVEEKKMDKFYCCECGENEVDDKDDMCDECAMQYNDEDEDEDEWDE